MSKKIKYMLAVVLAITLMVLFRHVILLLLVKLVFGALLIFVGIVGVYALFRLFAGLISVALMVAGMVLIFKIVQLACA
ncbi:hypothetical protein MF621_004215 (plasmid) [Bacillus velezensis]|uniref:hypothetical protein n=1 Tax=Bacillus amyloliquefaciens group TaxID=1938374 RepID=UPI00049F986B|nr:MULTISPECIES: hypothetical protein [Bacillus amyloliquefaciens group]KDN91210.1 hypothetical protein EF87_20080 [Bacillus amyloliquefaciens]MED2913939.1 hypothetical protein [Bacillus velezensis]UFD97715.1 hypothetical protein [Bacillus amyloliquefaciens]URJ76517.1 hypothetical protein MF619_004157 [Bacillus velezensis]URJ80523.1 hypothetical protein MF621_004215 [Bacillus velezensis]